jgi:DUF971 family protein
MLHKCPQETPKETRGVREMYEGVQPLDMRWTAQGEAQISWPDGHLSTYAPPLLRKICPCADCKGTHGPAKAFNILGARSRQEAEQKTRILGIQPIGSYAIAIEWGDGHRQGIYSYAYLRHECPCPPCEARRKSEQEEAE